jgi:DNA-directed RNA polymerase
MGRDEWGGRAVNLAPSTVPGDVYTGVAKLVEEKVEEDAAAGDEMAMWLKGNISRKVVKQTVMTSVYGVTFVGARAQIMARLEEVFPDRTRDELFAAAAYLSKATLKAVSTMFTGARQIMNWLTTSALLCAKQGQPVTWVTPLGWPVIQPYRKSDKFVVQTAMQRMLLVDANDRMPVSSVRQRSAFPPNFVHSLDSTHMIMTALECK